MKKKINIQITFDDNGKGIDSVMESILDTIKGHAPFVDEDIRLAMECDTDTDDESIILEADFSTEEPAKNGVISDMILASTVSILNSIKNMEEKA
jgi:hypothetical protein